MSERAIPLILPPPPLPGVKEFHVIYYCIGTFAFAKHNVRGIDAYIQRIWAGNFTSNGQTLYKYTSIYIFE